MKIIYKLTKEEFNAVKDLTGKSTSDIILACYLNKVGGKSALTNTACTTSDGGFVVELEIKPRVVVDCIGIAIRYMPVTKLLISQGKTLLMQYISFIKSFVEVSTKIQSEVIDSAKKSGYKF